MIGEYMRHVNKLSVSDYECNGKVEFVIADSGQSYWVEINTDRCEFTIFFESRKAMDYFIKSASKALHRPTTPHCNAGALPACSPGGPGQQAAR